MNTWFWGKLFANLTHKQNPTHQGPETSSPCGRRCVFIPVQPQRRAHWLPECWGRVINPLGPYTENPLLVTPFVNDCQFLLKIRPDLRWTVFSLVLTMESLHCWERDSISKFLLWYSYPNVNTAYWKPQTKQLYLKTHPCLQISAGLAIIPTSFAGLIWLVIHESHVHGPRHTFYKSSLTTLNPRPFLNFFFIVVVVVSPFFSTDHPYCLLLLESLFSPDSVTCKSSYALSVLNAPCLFCLFPPLLTPPPRGVLFLGFCSFHSSPCEFISF